MSAAKSSSKKRRGAGVAKSDLGKSNSSKDELDLFDADISNDIKGILSALHHIKEKAQKDGQKKNEETISSVASEIKSSLNELKSKIEKDKQNFAKSISKSSKECESCLKSETAKFQALYEKFCKDKVSHLQALKDTISKFEEEKERLFMRYEQQRKREKSMLSEHEKVCADKIALLEESLKKKKQDDKTFSILRKSLGSFLASASDEDIPADDLLS